MKPLTECLFCGNREYRFRFSASDRFFDLCGDYELHECCRCGLLFLNPQPEPEDLAAHYPTNYYAYKDESLFEARDEELYRIFYGQGSSWIAKLLHLPYRHALRTVTGGPGTRLLDVGCGAGHFLMMMKRGLGFDVYGVEAFGNNSFLADRHGLNIFHGTLSEAHFPDHFFDVVTMNHVLEHMPDPGACLKEVRRILNTDGTLIIGVPNSSSMLRYLFRKDWFPLEVPRHLFIPSIKNLTYFCAKQGFKLQRVRHYGGAESLLRSLLYRVKSRQPPELNRLSMIAGLAFAYPINFVHLSDVVELVLKPD